MAAWGLRRQCVGGGGLTALRCCGRIGSLAVELGRRQLGNGSLVAAVRQRGSSSAVAAAAAEDDEDNNNGVGSGGSSDEDDNSG
jgi:hypothetical protein